MEELTAVESWVPDYTKACIVCGQSPIVACIKNKKATVALQMCWACTLEEIEATHSDSW